MNFHSFFTLFCLSQAKILNIIDFGAIPGDVNNSMGLQNSAAISLALQSAQSGDTVLVPPSLQFNAFGGISAKSLQNVTFNISGSLAAIDDVGVWPHSDPQNYASFISLSNSKGLTITGGGVVDGRGKTWWNKDIIGALNGKRPKLLNLAQCVDSLIENLYLLNSPSFHLWVQDMLRAEIRNITVEVDRTAQSQLKAVMRQQRMQSGGWYGSLEPEDLNTDGIDTSGSDIYIHDCIINNDDDSIAIKPCDGNCVSASCSQNMLIERVRLTGFGASIGSVPPSGALNCVKNITFRDIVMPKTGKGIYIKSNPTCDVDGLNHAVIQNITFENISIEEPSWWAIWIGPQQQHEPGTPLGNKCSLEYPVIDWCPTQSCVSFIDIVLRNVTISDPWLSPGVILGNSSNPMRGIVFDHVEVTHSANSTSGYWPFEGNYQCMNAMLDCVHCEPAPVC
jgi:polygalacturonase